MFALRHGQSIGFVFLLNSVMGFLFNLHYLTDRKPLEHNCPGAGTGPAFLLHPQKCRFQAEYSLASQIPVLNRGWHSGCVSGKTVKKRRAV